MNNRRLIHRTEEEAGFFYGYVIVAAAFLMMVVMWGAYYAFGIFFKPVLTEFGWSRATLSGAASLALFTSGLLGIVMGALTDRFGPRLVMMICGFLLGLGYLLMSKINAVWQLYLFYGLIIGTGMGGSFIPLITTIARWFLKRRGAMTGIVVAGVGIGAFIGSPLAHWAISVYGWRRSYVFMALSVFAVIMLFTQFIRNAPGQFEGPTSADGEGSLNPQRNLGQGLTLKEAVKTMRFWILVFILLCFGIPLHSVMVHIVPHATELGISASSAAKVLSIIGGVSIIGKVSMGRACDGIGTKRVVMIGLILMSIALFLVAPVKELWLLSAFAVVFGFAYGGSVASHSPLVADLFGLSSHGLILGVAGLGVTIGGAIGPLLTGYLFDLQGSYRLAFIIGGAICLLGSVLSKFLPAAKKVE
ncbi:MFS transporter [Thermodesulfobacteriota bacterium]